MPPQHPRFLWIAPRRRRFPPTLIFHSKLLVQMIRSSSSSPTCTCSASLQSSEKPQSPGVMDLNDPAKRLKLVSMDMCEDRISMLPNAILCHILSFLPTQFAVRTNVLSKRWENVWTSVPILDFDEWSMMGSFHCGRKHVYKQKIIWFINFVERVLTLHDRVNIQKCVLHCFEASTYSHFYRWVSAIITCKVQEFIIQASSDYDVPIQLPQSLFTCRTLTVLKIKGKFLLNNPSSVCFPCVKTLQLHSVFYPDDDSVERLFASCPVVEDLDIERSTWDVVLNFNISIPSLKRLSMGSYTIRSTNRKTVVNAPNLEYLKLRGDPFQDYSFCITSSLVEAKISGTSSCGLLKKISHVRVLTLSGETMMGLFFGDGKDNLPIFGNLTRMELGLERRLGLQLLKYLLEHSPNLEDLVFLEGLARSETSEARGIWRPRCVPAVLLIHIKTIEIRKFWGRQYEVRLVEHLLKRAVELERMTIYWDDFDKDMKAQEIGNRMKMRPRASTSCELNIISAHCNYAMPI